MDCGLSCTTEDSKSPKRPRREESSLVPRIIGINELANAVVRFLFNLTVKECLALQNWVKL